MLIANVCEVNAQTNETEAKGKQSLIEMAPGLFYTAKRSDKFYGDANTAHGDIGERSYLLGDWGGSRDNLADKGVYLDFGLTQFAQSNVSGGNKTPSEIRYTGSADTFLWLDTGKAGWWSGGALFVHGEGSWSPDFNSDVGSMLPANFDETMPTNEHDWAVSEYYLIQGLPGNLLATVGKTNMAAWAGTNVFANKERTQFTYTGLVSNAIAGVFFPYTTLGASLTWEPSKSHAVTAVWAKSEGKATAAAFDELDNNDNSYALQYIYSTQIDNRPGHYLLAAAASTKDIASFDISERQLIGEIIGLLPEDEKSENYAVIGNFAQYLWVEDGSAAAYNRRIQNTSFSGITHHNDPPVGIGLFGRAGWAPDDRNAIDQFYSFGIGGFGMLIPGRDDDQWGVGWAGSHISDDLRELDSSLRSWEHALEIFYNFALTPAVHLTLDSQTIRPASKSYDTAQAFGARLQVDF